MRLSVSSANTVSFVVQPGWFWSSARHRGAVRASVIPDWQRVSWQGGERPTVHCWSRARPTVLSSGATTSLQK